jgi:hypothetical protein
MSQPRFLYGGATTTGMIFQATAGVIRRRFKQDGACKMATVDAFDSGGVKRADCRSRWIKLAKINTELNYLSRELFQYLF